MDVNNKGIIYNFDRDSNEINDMFYERCWKAAKQNPKNEEDLLEAIRLSKLWVYKKYYGCSYSNEVEDTVSKLN